MKLSLSWIFDHIEVDQDFAGHSWQLIAIEEIIKKINSITAEIESFEKINININDFQIAKVIEINDKISLNIIDLNKTIELSYRLDAKKDEFYLIKKNKDEFKWATLIDLGSQKEGLIPNLYISDIANWKKQFETQDYILHLDNKSITNRPDLWGHRGFAREIAAIFNLPLKPIDSFIIKKNVVEFESLKNSDIFNKFATYYIPEIQIKPSSLAMANRLAKIDCRPINLIVDTTNYVMFDISQPMHTYDANKIQGQISPRFARNSEIITLLDNETIKLTDKDLIIADNEKPICLAGIMGSTNSEIDNNTTSILVESANFKPELIRKTSTSVKKRTEASARFEKSLDPEQNITGIERFIKILSENNTPIESTNIKSYGIEIKPTLLIVSHNFIEKKLGTKLSYKFVVDTLEKLEFIVKQIPDTETFYEIIVPSFRATKDITIPEDIVEEIARFFGYENIQFILPAKQIKPNNLLFIRRLRKIKQFMAFAANMHEVQNYPFYDENFIKELKWQPAKSTKVISPISENWVRLVDSLIPHLLKNIQQNILQPQKLCFFEINNIWDTISETTTVEKKSLSGIFFDKKKSIDFYECKEYLIKMFNSLGFDNINWQKNENLMPWYSKYQTAQLIYNKKCIGYAGMVCQSFLENITSGNAFIFELDAQFLLNEPNIQKRFKNISKYPYVWLDISLLVPLNITVKDVIDLIKSCDPKIYKVELIDHFENSKWDNQKSITLRYYLVDEHKTLSKEEIDAVINNINQKIKNIGAQIR